MSEGAEYVVRGSSDWPAGEEQKGRKCKERVSERVSEEGKRGQERGKGGLGSGEPEGLTVGQQVVLLQGAKVGAGEAVLGGQAGGTQAVLPSARGRGGLQLLLVPGGLTAAWGGGKRDTREAGSEWM